MIPSLYLVGLAETNLVLLIVIRVGISVSTISTVGTNSTISVINRFTKVVSAITIITNQSLNSFMQSFLIKFAFIVLYLFVPSSSIVLHETASNFGALSPNQSSVMSNDTSGAISGISISSSSRHVLNLIIPQINEVVKLFVGGIS